MDTVPASEPRYCVAQVTEEARDAWRDFCDRQAIDRTTLAEVIGSWFTTAPDPLPPQVQRWVNEARDLKNQRRRRG